MSIKKNIRRIIFICMWLIIGSGLIVLLIAAVNARNHQLCKGYKIEFKEPSANARFLDKKDVEKVLTNNKRSSVIGKPVKSFNLKIVEERLKKEPWIKDAEIFFDNDGILKVLVEERQPIARLFSTSGGSFYIDSSGQRLPLSIGMTAKLPVFTGYPIEVKKVKTPAERKLVREVKELSLFLLNDPFWMAQISQIDITPSKEFEMIPTVGNHLIEFGDGSDYKNKFNRLFIFYKQVLAKTGMEKYERLKVQYDSQVIGIKKQDN